MRKLNKVILIFIAALVFRLSLIFIAYHGDLNNNLSWGTLAQERGLAGFYESKDWPYSAPNQPPLTILTFSTVRLIWQTIENTSWWLNDNFKIFPSPFIWFWEARGMILLAKLPSILADLGIAWLIYRHFFKAKNENLGLGLSALWLFNPVSWYNSAIWGQTDAVVNLLGLASILSLFKRNLTLSFVFLTLSLLFKGSLLIFVPILIFIAVWQKHKLSAWIRSVLASLGVVILVSVWFHPSLDLLLWLKNLYIGRILPGEIGFLTANAFNFWWLINPGETLDSQIFFGLPARIWGLVAAASGILSFVFLLRRKFSNQKALFFLALSSLLTFLFMTRIHERYLYPFFPLTTILLGFYPGLILPYLILSLTHLFNLYHLFWAPGIPALEGLYGIAWFPQLISIVNILIFFYLLRLLRPRAI